MAVTKIHPIKSTLKAALDYIMDSNKLHHKLLNLYLQVFLAFL